MCLRAKGIPESTATFSVEAAGQVYSQTNEFVYLGGNVNHNADLSIEVMPTCPSRSTGAYATHGCSCQKYTLELYDRSSASLELKTRMLRAEVLETMLYGCVTWSPRACHYDKQRRAHHRILTRWIGWRKHKRAAHPISYLDTLIKTGSESCELVSLLVVSSHLRIDSETVHRSTGVGFRLSYVGDSALYSPCLFALLGPFHIQGS